MKKRLFKMVSSSLAGLILSGTIAMPAHAGGRAELRSCLDAADTGHERSQCYWRHWEYRASYGR